MAQDGFVLSALLVLPVHRCVDMTVQFNPATGVKKEYYLNFARYLAEQGCRVILFDYRGIGDSKPGKLKNFGATMLDWGLLDMNGVTHYIQQHFDDTPLVYAGHSIGGQLAGLNPYAGSITRVVAINSSTGYWRHFRFPYNWLSLFLWKVFVPLTTRMLRYAPTSLCRLGEDLPSGVARQWSQWCMSKDHFEETLLKQTGKRLFGNFRVPFTLINPEDDYIARPANIERLCAFYPASPITLVTLRRLSPADPPIGHVGLFRSAMKNRYWPLLSLHIRGEDNAGVATQ